jgi:hypothetical protein
MPLCWREHQIQHVLLPEDSVSTAEQEEHSGLVWPREEQDVVLFLSNDGDSEPIHLLSDWPVASAPLPAPADAGQTLAGNEDVDEDSTARVCPADASAGQRAHPSVASAAPADAGQTLAGSEDVDEVEFVEQVVV